MWRDRFNIDLLDFCFSVQTTQAIEAFEQLSAEMGAEEEQYLAYLDYQTFLATTYWRTVRAYMLARADYMCRHCASHESLEVHHLTYAHRGCEWRHLRDLVVLCRECHQEEHGT